MEGVPLSSPAINFSAEVVNPCPSTTDGTRSPVEGRARMGKAVLTTSFEYILMYSRG